MNTFVTHPSVRIKGTENNYNPLRCIEPNCPDHSLHMHCPFCVKTEFYHDPVILKAHFRVKHVDKGIDFAGLKILRCCDHCDIVGIIKGEKKFKGAHWHCYKCRNGFNRRDEAIKHYKTHFRNPQTTFQIQIAQEINSQMNSYNDSVANSTATLDQSGLSIHPALTQAVMSTSLNEGHSLLNNHNTHVSMSNSKSTDGTVHVSVAANETVDSTDPPTHHIMIIQEDPTDSASGDGNYTTQIISGEDVGMAEEKEQADHQNSDNRYEELQQKYHQVLLEKSQQEQQLNSEIERLRSQVYTLKAEIVSFQKREQELLEQISVPLDKNIESLLKQLEVQHRDLLHQQLLCLKRQYKPQTVTPCNGPQVHLTATEHNTVSTDEKDLSSNVYNSEDEGKTNLEKSTRIFKNDDVSSSADKIQDNLDECKKVNDSENTEIVVVNEMSLEERGTDRRFEDSEREIDSVKTTSGSYVVCIEYNGIPLDDSGNLHVTQDLNLDMQSSDDTDEPLAKRMKNE